VNLISFKNVGITEFEASNLVSFVSRSIVPVGIKMPISFGLNSLFEMNLTFENQIKDNLKNLLLTNHGERLGNYFYGANLKPLLTEYTNIDSFNNEAMKRINTAILRYMNYVVPEEFGSEEINDKINLTSPSINLKIILNYTVPRINQKNKKTIAGAAPNTSIPAFFK
jgi:phage baseplate assembly protein W